WDFSLPPMLSSRMLKRIAAKRGDKASDEQAATGEGAEIQTQEIHAQEIQPQKIHAKEIQPRESKGASHSHTSKDSRFFGFVDRVYGRLLNWSLNHRFAVVAVALATFALTFPLNAMVGRDWIPPDDQSELTISMNWPEGTSIDGTSKLAVEIADRIKQEIPEIEFVHPLLH